MSLSHQDYDYLIKVKLIGDDGVGKTTLLKTFTSGKYEENYLSYLDVEFGYKVLEVGNKVIQFQIWDSPGQERFRTLTTNPQYNAFNAFILVFDPTDTESFNNIKQWHNKVNRYVENPKFILVGTKADIPKNKYSVTDEMIQALAKKIEAPYFAVSSKTNFNLDKVFKEIASIFLKSSQEQKQESPVNTLKVKEIKTQGIIPKINQNQIEIAAQQKIMQILESKTLSIQNFDEINNLWDSISNKEIDAQQWKVIRDTALRKFLGIIDQENAVNKKAYLKMSLDWNLFKEKAHFYNFGDTDAIKTLKSQFAAVVSAQKLFTNPGSAKEHNLSLDHGNRRNEGP